MINKEAYQKAAEYIKKKSTADDFTLSIFDTDNVGTRFAENAITQHMAGQDIEIELQSVYNGQKGSASITQLDNKSLDYIIKTSENIARANKPDPEYVPSESKKDFEETLDFSETTENLTIEEMVDKIKKCTTNSQKLGASLSGISEKFVSEKFICTKNGFEGYDKSTEYSHSMTMRKDHIETKVSKGVKESSLLDIDNEIERLNSQFNALKTKGRLEAQKIPVILRPDAVNDLFFFVFWQFALREADKGITPYTDSLNKKFFGDKFSFASVNNDKELFFSPFDSTGVLSKNIDWVKDGVIKNMYTSRYYAKEKGLEAISPQNYYVAGGNATEEEMMSRVKRGLILNRLWYIRDIDMKKGELTGMTRDGVLYFEDGKVKNSVNNFRFNEIPIDVTKRILALGKSVALTPQHKIPTMLVDDFNFVDATSF